MSQPEFEIVDRADQELIFIGLKKIIETCDGIAFHNGDLGHPVYLAGASGRQEDSLEYADSPDKNRLFRLLSTISKKYIEDNDTGYTWFYDFSTWENFCKFVVDCYKRRPK